MLPSSAERGETETWRSKKSIFVTTLIVLVLVGSVVGMGCSPTGDGGEGLLGSPREEALPGSSNGPGHPGTRTWLGIYWPE